MYTIKIKLGDLNTALKGLDNLFKDLTPITRAITGILQQASERAFLQEESPEDEPWQALTPKYKNIRVKEGSLGRILDRTHAHVYKLKGATILIVTP